MARVKLSPIFTNISGSIGGMTVQRNRFGVSLRQKPLPIKSNSPSQYIVRQHITTIQHAWQDLTDVQRLQWNRFLDFSGQTINNDKSVKLSGHALYLKYQLFRLLSGYSLLTTITYIPMPKAVEIACLCIAADSLILSTEDDAVHTEFFFLFKVTTSRHKNQAFSPRGLRYMFTTPATAQNFQIKEAYKTAFGILPANLSWFHYSLQSFSVLAPVYSGVVSGKFQITV